MKQNPHKLRCPTCHKSRVFCRGGVWQCPVCGPFKVDEKQGNDPNSSVVGEPIEIYQVKKMSFDQNLIQSKNDMQEILSAVNQRLGTVIEHEMSERLMAEDKKSARNALDALLRQMENLSHLQVVCDTTGTQEELIQRRGRAAVVVKDLLVQLDEFAKGRQSCSGNSQFSRDIISAIYYGHQIFSAVERERPNLFQYLPVSQPAPTAPAAAPEAPAFEEIIISTRSEK